MRRPASALLGALALLVLATLVGRASLVQTTQWRYDYQRELTANRQALRAAYRRWEGLPTP